ncbi:MAG: phosphoglycerate mutase family protein [Pyrinomonadaceae bacterium]
MRLKVYYIIGGCRRPSEYEVMKILVSIFFGIAFCTVANTVLLAQDREITVILVRHAEKADATSTDPELSATGKERAQRLVEKIGKYRPGAFYSTDFKRTRYTIAALAAKRKKEVKIYDARKPQELIDQMMKSKTKRFVVAGHSNTVPGLANLIAKKELFKNLDDSEYTVIWLLRLKNGKVTKLELLDY